MAKFLCECGHVHETVSYPNERAWQAVRSNAYEALIEAEVTRDKLRGAEEGTAEWLALLEADTVSSQCETTIWECPNCNRLMWFRGGPVRIYRLEKEVD